MKRISKGLSLVLAVMFVFSAAVMNVFAATDSGDIALDEVKEIVINANQGTMVHFTPTENNGYQIIVPDDSITCELYTSKNNKIPFTTEFETEDGKCFAYGDVDGEFKRNTGYYFLINCEESITCEVVVKVYHNFIKTDEKTEPTCSREGEEYYNCIICGESKTEKIPKAEHEYDSFGVCVNCGNIEETPEQEEKNPITVFIQKIIQFVRKILKFFEDLIKF